MEISGLMLDEYVDTLAEKGIKFKYDLKAKKYLASKSFGGHSGARDLRNLIRKEVEDKIAAAIVESRDGIITAIHVSAVKSGIKLDIL